MYRSRHHRTTFYGNLAWELPSLPYSWSIGFYTGLALQSRIFMQTSLEKKKSGDQSNASYSRMTSHASPTLAAVASLARRWRDSSLAVTMQQEMTHPLSFHIQGNVTDPVATFDNTMDTLAYYDPWLLRLSYYHQRQAIGLYSTLEYQYWKNYQSPVMRIKRNSTHPFTPSHEFEQLSLRNIFIPKLGVSYQFNPRHQSRLGMAYQPTPLGGDFSGPGNSVDTAKIIYSLGHQLQVQLFDQALALDFSLQYHHLISRRVVKQKGIMENGAKGEKVGSPGYQLGGHLLTTALGLNIRF